MKFRGVLYCRRNNKLSDKLFVCSVVQLCHFPLKCLSTILVIWRVLPYHLLWRTHAHIPECPDNAHTHTHTHLEIRIFWVVDQLALVQWKETRTESITLSSLLLGCFLNLCLSFYFLNVPVTTLGYMSIYWFYFDLYYWNCVLKKKPLFSQILFLQPTYVFSLPVQRLPKGALKLKEMDSPGLHPHESDYSICFWVFPSNLLNSHFLIFSTYRYTAEMCSGWWGMRYSHLPP